MNKELLNKLKSICIKTDDELIISPNGNVQSWLIDLRIGFLQSETLNTIAQEFWKIYKNYPPFQIAAIETTAIPLLGAILLSAPNNHKPLNGLIVRKQRKTTGLGNLIEGISLEKPVVLIDDIINSSSTAEKARISIGTRNISITDFFSILNFETNKAKEWASNNNIKIQSLFTLKDFGLKNNTVSPTPPIQKYKQLWSTNVSGGNFFNKIPKSTPLYYNEKIYRGCDGGVMHCFDSKTGNVVWEYKTTGNPSTKGIISSPAIYNDKLYFGAYNGVAYCLDAITGQEFWKQSHADWIGASPLIVPEHNLVCFGLEYSHLEYKGGLAALDLTTGEKVWEHQICGLQHGSPAYSYDEDIIVWPTADDKIYGLNPSTGNILWTFKTKIGGHVKYAPTICEKRKIVSFASFDKSIYILDLKTGNLISEFVTDEICYTTPLIYNDRLFCGSGDKHLYVIDLNTMKIIKKLNFNSRIYSSPVVIDNNIVFGCNDGKVVEIDSNTLETKSILLMADSVTNSVCFTPDYTKIFVSTYMNQLCGFERI